MFYSSTICILNWVLVIWTKTDPALFSSIYSKRKKCCRFDFELFGYTLDRYLELAANDNSAKAVLVWSDCWAADEFNPGSDPSSWIWGSEWSHWIKEQIKIWELDHKWQRSFGVDGIRSGLRKSKILPE